MSWLRLDDGMPEHRKVLALPRKDRWTWLELLAYVARQNNGGHVPNGITDVLRWVTPTFLKQCVDAGLLDHETSTQPVPNQYHVHDWDIYNSTTTPEKIASILTRNPDKTANEIHKMIGGNRGAVLAEVAKQRGLPGTEPVPNSTATGTPSRAYAFPSPTPKELTTATTSVVDAAADLNRLRHAGWTTRQLQQAQANPARAVALLEEAELDPTCSNPAALAWTKYEAGVSPTIERTSIAQGATGTRSSSPSLPDRPAAPEPERIQPPADFLALVRQPGVPSLPPRLPSRPRVPRPSDTQKETS